MHLGSVLVGIVIGIVLGLWLGWLASSPRRRRGSDDLRAPLYQERVTAPERPPPAPEPELPRAWSEAPKAVLEPEAQPIMPATLVVPGSDRHGAQPDQSEKEEALIAELRAVNMRLTREAQTRLSRPSGDGSSEAHDEAHSDARPKPAEPETPGQDLLERSRRLAEDAKQRLARDPNSEGG